MFDRHSRRNRLLSALLGAAAMVVSLPGVASSQDVLGSRVNVLMAFDFSDHYITPRGLQVENRGLVTQPLVLLFWKLHASDRGVTDVTLTTGLWNSFHTQRSGMKPSRWNEIDPILGLTVGLGGRVTVDATTTAFYTPTDSYATSTHLDLKATYNDTFLQGISLKPYVAYWRELNNKSTVMFDRATSDEGFYLTIGATPTVGLGATGATLEVPVFANFVSADFYQRFDGSDGGSGLAVLSVSPRVNLPLRFLGTSHGAWTAYAGVGYSNLRNEGLLDGNEVLTPDATRTSNLTRLRGGLTVFF